MTAEAKSKHPDLKQEKHTTAIFMPKTDEKGKTLPDAKQKANKVEVHFNPESLDITFTNSVQKGKKNQPAQVSVTEATAKLSMELIFDTTLKGIDVRTETIKLARMMDPAQKTPRKKKAQKKQIPSIVIFQWGTIWFEGYIDSYKEKIDFFSAEGVPLRATVSLSMTQQQRDFNPNEQAPYAKVSITGGDISLQSHAPINRIGQNTSVTDAAKNFGNPAAARSVAALNGIENIRLPEVDELLIMEPGLPQAPRFNMSMSQDGANLGLQADGEIAGMFSNLRSATGYGGASPAGGGGLSLDMESHFNGSMGVSANASFGVGGQVDVDSNASLSADVGIFADIELGIQFEE